MRRSRPQFFVSLEIDPNRRVAPTWRLHLVTGERVRPSVLARDFGLSAGARQARTVTDRPRADGRGGRLSYVAVPTPARSRRLPDCLSLFVATNGLSSVLG